MSERDLAYRNQMKELDSMITEKETCIHGLITTISMVYADALHLKTELEKEKIKVPPEVQHILNLTYARLESVNDEAGIDIKPSDVV
ncbi:MAG: hypothetical protein ACW99Q_24605 [Candidatus Kariarchaeaceae archaeon]|jgi:hypothetical protein